MASSPADVYEAQHLQDMPDLAQRSQAARHWADTRRAQLLVQDRILARYPRTLSLLAQAVRKTDIAMKTHCYKIENNW